MDITATVGEKIPLPAGYAIMPLWTKGKKVRFRIFKPDGKFEDVDATEFAGMEAEPVEVPS